MNRHATGWDELATNDDLGVLRSDSADVWAEVRSEVADLRVEIRTQVRSLFLPLVVLQITGAGMAIAVSRLV